jgi:hypothetical protein
VHYASNLNERNGNIDTNPAAIAAQLMMTRYLPVGSAELPIPSVAAIQLAQTQPSTPSSAGADKNSAQTCHDAFLATALVECVCACHNKYIAIPAARGTADTVIGMPLHRSSPFSSQRSPYLSRRGTFKKSKKLASFLTAAVALSSPQMPAVFCFRNRQYIKPEHDTARDARN